MRTPTAFLLITLSVLASPSHAVTPDSWQSSLIDIRSSLRPSLTLGRWAMTERASREEPGDGEGLACLDYGRHTRDLPSFNPMDARRECLSDPLPGEAAFRTAWSRLVERVRQDGGEPVAVTPPLGSVYYQQAVGLGNTSGMGRGGSTRYEHGHWGDAAGLDLAMKDGELVVVGGWVYLLRAYKISVGGREYIKAERAVFHADSEGRLISVIRHDGELAPATGAFMWPPMPSRMDGPNGVSGIHAIQWRQLVAAWAAR